MDNITEPGTYRQRNGDIVDVLKINGDEPYPIRAVGGKSWTRSGQFDRNTPRGNYDLVERVGDLPAAAPVVEFAVTSPGVYRMRNGEMVKVVDNPEAKHYPWMSDAGDYTWAKKGETWANEIRSADLVERVGDLPGADEAAPVVGDLPASDEATVNSIVSAEATPENELCPITGPGEYVTRNGEVVAIVANNFGNKVYPWRSGSRTWTASGRFSINGSFGLYDIVRRSVDRVAEFAITGPGVYRRRDGETVEVVENVADTHHFPWCSSDKATSWTHSGCEWTSGTGPRDLVERVGDLPAAAPTTEFAITGPGVYRRRDGDTVEVVASHHDEYPWCDLDRNCSWARNGALYIGETSGSDLVERVGEPVPAPTTNPQRDALAIEYSKIMLARDGKIDERHAVFLADAMLAALRGDL